MKNGALLLAVLIILGGVGWYLFSSVPVAEAPADNAKNADRSGTSTDTDVFNTHPNIVDSFADCVAVGNPVMESYPRQCRDDGVTYTESIPDAPATSPTATEPVACTMDAKVCPDGSAVGRVGPHCEFAPCPGEEPSSSPGSASPPDRSTVCSPESRLVDACTEEYAPVCGLRAVQCVTEPCDPVPETFSNGCFACMDENVISYTAGACGQ